MSTTMTPPLVQLVIDEDIAGGKGRFWAWRGHPDAGGTLLCKSRQPILDAARKLVELGHDPATMMQVCRRRGRARPDIWREPISEAARWTIEESDARGMRRRLWKAFSSRDVVSENSDSDLAA